MTKSKSLTTRAAAEAMLTDPLDPTRAGKCHHYAKLHLAIGAAYAVLCGVELQRIQAALKKSATRCTFEEWLDKNADDLGFNRRMAFSYKAIAEHVKSKLLVTRDHDVMALLDRSPSSLHPGEQKTLLAAVNKAVDGQSIRDLLEELSIARGERVCLTGPDPKRKPNATRGVPSEAWIQEELFGRIGKAEKVIEWWAKPVKLAGSREHVPLWQTMTQAQKADMEKKLTLSIADQTAMLAQLQEAKKRK